jgi:DNA-binding MarR family transcriptional regulator
VDEAYWRGRCLAAERALALARRGLQLSAQRKAVLELLADLKGNANADTHRIAGLLGCSPDRAHEILKKMEDLGLIDREQGRRGVGGFPSGWRLGHMVHVEPTE